ncbi:MAG: hypothetical protein HOE89_02175 [Gammaproteobacteria bacterium]|nr:hypothetical protein [Gammaproteobacteria bacterium]MBT5744358.1 hypothetical protein [Gammaproteobacteria bacterium]
MKHYLLISMAIASLFAANSASSQAVTNWQIQGQSLILSASTNTNNTSIGRSAVLALAFEKSFLSCKPSLAFLSFQGSRLGSIERTRSNKRESNQLKLTINNRTYVADGETVLNTYSNGVEIVAYFEDSIIAALSNAAIISVSVGDGDTLISYRTHNDIRSYITEIRDACD